MQPELILPVRGSEWGGHRLQVYLDCPKKYYWNYLHGGVGIEPQVGKPGTRFGTIIHHGLQVFYESMKQHPALTYVTHCRVGIQAAEALICENTELTPEERMELLELSTRCLTNYFMEYEKSDLVPLEMEHPFTLDIEGFEHTGIIDLLGKYAGHTVVVDHKTTGLDWATFFKKWRFDLSLLGYVYYARKKYGKPVHLLINGIRKTKHKVPQFEFSRELYVISDEDMTEWFNTVHLLRNQIHERQPEHLWIKNPGQCTSAYGECSYRKLCTFPDAAMEQTFYKPREKR